MSEWDGLSAADIYTLIDMSPGSGPVPNARYGFDPNWVGRYTFAGIPTPPPAAPITPEITNTEQPPSVAPEPPASAAPDDNPLPGETAGGMTAPAPAPAPVPRYVPSGGPAELPTGGDVLDELLRRPYRLPEESPNPDIEELMRRSVRSPEGRAFDEMMRKPIRAPDARAVLPEIAEGVAAMVGPIIAGIVGVLWPSSMGSGELPPNELAKREPSRWPEAPAPRPQLPTQTAGEPPAPPTAPPRPPALEELPVPRLDRLPPIPSTVQPSPIGPPKSAAPAPRTTTRTVPQPSPLSFPSPSWWQLAPALLRMTNTARMTNTQPITMLQPAPLPLPPPIEAGPSLPLPSPSPSPSPSPVPMPWAGGAGGGNCDCSQCRRSKKKPRKCLERGELVWRSGPKKGKPAGTRCVRFAT